MDINPGTQYTISRSGQQFGPMAGADLVDCARNQQIIATDHLWAEGMEDWVPAGTFTELAAVLGQVQVTPEKVDAPPKTVVMAAMPMVNNPIAAQANKQINRTKYKAANLKSEPVRGERKGASFGLWLFTLLMIVLGVIGYSGLVGLAINSPETRPLPEKPYVIWGLMGMVILGFIFNTVLSLKYLHRAWAYIQDLPNVTTTPGKAVGFLFIPLFNIVWIFFAYYKWSGDYNLRCDLSPSHAGPRAKEGLFLAHCILSLIGLPILFIFVMHQMCRSINHLSTASDLDLVSSYS